MFRSAPWSSYLFESRLAVIHANSSGLGEIAARVSLPRPDAIICPLISRYCQIGGIVTSYRFVGSRRELGAFLYVSWTRGESISRILGRTYLALTAPNYSPGSSRGEDARDIRMRITIRMTIWTREWPRLRPIGDPSCTAYLSRRSLTAPARRTCTEKEEILVWKIVTEGRILLAGEWIVEKVLSLLKAPYIGTIVCFFFYIWE